MTSIWRKIWVLLVLGFVIPPIEAEADEAVATINGDMITQQEVFELFRKRYPQQTAEVIRELVVRYIIEREAKANKIRVGRKEVIAKAQEEYSQTKQQVEEQLRKPWREYLAARGMSEEELKQELVDKWRYNIALQRLIRLHQHQFDRIQARHILIKDEQEAQRVWQKLQQGADFATLAKQNSQHESSKQNGGLLPLIFRGDLPPPLDKAIWKLQPGEISEVIETKLGFHIIKVLQRHPQQPDASWRKLAKEITASLKQNPITPTDISRWLRDMSEKYQIKHYLLDKLFGATPK